MERAPSHRTEVCGLEPLLSAFREHDGDGRVVLDLSGVRFMRPVHLVAAAARAHAARGAGDAFHLVGPTWRDPGVYAARMRLGSQILELGGTHNLPMDVREHDRAGSLLEISRIAHHDHVRALATLVHDKVKAADEAMASALYESICEIGLNVQDHAEAVGFVVAQTMPMLRELRFAVGDAGQGVLATLRHRGADDHRSAIELALDGVSRHDDPGRGTGVLETARLVTELRGEVLLVSGNAEVVQSATSRRHRGTRQSFRGTLFEASIPLPRGRHAARWA